MNSQSGVVQTIALVAFTFGLAAASNFWPWHRSVAKILTVLNLSDPLPRNFGTNHCVNSGIIVNVKLKFGPLLRLRSLIPPNKLCIFMSDFQL